ncbi:MAG: BCCT family transporter [Clostridiales bacterium]|nr:BCCT family transporter [Clostridiales bacterium]
MKKKLDPATTIIPFAIILALCGIFIIYPVGSTNVLAVIRTFLGDTFGSYYLVVGLGILIVSLYIAYSPIGNITLGKPGEKPRYNFWTWGAMVFTCGLAADILFYSLCEWIYYAQEPHVTELGVQDWANAYSLFHWGPIPWSFYAVLAAAFGFMLHVRGRTKQKYSEACRPILGRYTDKLPGKAVDVLAVFALIAGTATTFSVATPLLANSVTALFGGTMTKWISIVILLVVCATYTASVMNGLKGVERLSNICMYLFGALLIYVLFVGGQTRYIIESGLTALGNAAQNFIGMSTWTDAGRTSSFPQNWTIFYWAYWLVWCVAAPFFMGGVSRGRTVRQVIMGSYIFGVLSTIISFIVLGNYGLGAQLVGKVDALGIYTATGDIYGTVIEIIKTIPLYPIVLVLIIFSMVAFYASSFDSITLVACQYSYLETTGMEASPKKMRLFWAVFLILLPIALIFSEGSMNNLQTVSIIAAFPIGLVIILIIASFIKDAKNYLKRQ